MGEELVVEQAEELEQFQAMSRIHAMGWRDTYADALPVDWMKKNVTDDRWVETFQEYARGGINHCLLLRRGADPVTALTYGPARIGDQSHGGGEIVHFDAEGYEGWGEVISFYTHPAERGKGYGGLLLETALERMKKEGFSDIYLFVLRENEKARRFYERHGFAWDGTQQEIPFPPDTVCIDLRYVLHF